MLNQITLYQLSFDNEYFFNLFFINCVHFFLFPKYTLHSVYWVILPRDEMRCAPYSDGGRCGEGNSPPVGLKQKRFSFLSNKKISSEVVHFFRYFFNNRDHFTIET